MGYCAQGSGWVEIKKDLTLEDKKAFLMGLLNDEAVVEAFEGYNDETCEFMKKALWLYDWYEVHPEISKDPLGIELTHEYGKYHGEELQEELSLFIPVAESIEMNFCGDDEQRWRFRLKDGEIEEDNYDSIVLDDIPNAIRAEGLGLSEETIARITDAIKRIAV